jgi:hypothetical protein
MISSRNQFDYSTLHHFARVKDNELLLRLSAPQCPFHVSYTRGDKACCDPTSSKASPTSALIRLNPNLGSHFLNSPLECSSCNTLLSLALSRISSSLYDIDVQYEASLELPIAAAIPTTSTLDVTMADKRRATANTWNSRGGRSFNKTRLGRHGEATIATPDAGSEDERRTRRDVLLGLLGLG